LDEKGTKSQNLAFLTKKRNSQFLKKFGRTLEEIQTNFWTKVVILDG